MKYEEIMERYAPVLSSMRQAADEAAAAADRLACLRVNLAEACELYERKRMEADRRRMKGNVEVIDGMIDDTIKAMKAARWSCDPVTPERQARAKAVDDAMTAHDKAAADIKSLFDAGVMLLCVIPTFDADDRRTVKDELRRLASLMADEWKAHYKKVIAI